MGLRDGWPHASHHTQPNPSPSLSPSPAPPHQVAKQVDEFDSTQGLVNVAWAFATAGHVSPPLFDAIGGSLERRAAECAPQARQ